MISLEPKKELKVIMCDSGVRSSGGSRPSDKGEGGEGGHPDPEIRGGGVVFKKCFSALRVSVWSKNKAGPGPPGSLPWIRL